MSKFFFNRRESYIPKVDIYFTAPFWAYFVDQLAIDSGRQVVCDTLSGPCANVGFAVEPNCIAGLTSLPAYQGNLSYIDGNSQGCRFLHAVLARQNPELHCAHVTLNTTDPDPSGSVKCSVSDGLLPENYFSPGELGQFADFCRSVGIDPDLGYKVA